MIYVFSPRSILCFFFSGSGDHRDLHSFPTRRSSDLDPRMDLVRRLQEYERFKTAAENIDTMPRVGREIFLAQDRKSTRLNSSHVEISYAVFCLKKKTITTYVCESGSIRS